MEIKDAIKAGDRLPISGEILQDAKDLITDCWNDSPKIRQTFAQILERLTGSNAVMPNSSTHSIGAPKYAEIKPSTGRTSPRRRNVSKKIWLLILAFVLIVVVAGGIGLYVSLSSIKANISSFTTLAVETTSPSTFVTAITSSSSSAANPTSSSSSSPTLKGSLQFPALFLTFPLRFPYIF